MDKIYRIRSELAQDVLVYICSLADIEEISTIEEYFWEICPEKNQKNLSKYLDKVRRTLITKITLLNILSSLKRIFKELRIFPILLPGKTTTKLASDLIFLVFQPSLTS